MASTTVESCCRAKFKPVTKYTHQLINISLYVDMNNIQSNLMIRNFLVILKLFLNAKFSLFLWSKLVIGHRKWFLNTNLFLIKPFLITKFDCTMQFHTYFEDGTEVKKLSEMKAVGTFKKDWTLSEVDCFSENSRAICLKSIFQAWLQRSRDNMAIFLHTLCCISLRRCVFGLKTRVIIKILTHPF